MKKFRCLVFILVFFIPYLSSGQTPTKNANNSIAPYTGPFSYGVNLGYYSGAWSDESVARLASKADATSVRLFLPDYFIGKFGLYVRSKEFAYYKENLNLQDNVLFIGAPSAEHQDKTVFPGSNKPSNSFVGLYEPIWIKNSFGKWTVNPANTFAEYVFNLTVIYGGYVKFWEVVNEPDFTYNWADASKEPGQAGSWYDGPPRPGDLTNLQCPIFYYVRMLRITYEVVKKMNPDSYITTGGIGYDGFLDACLRYTDNPDNGKVTDKYPLKGGAYFDVASFHYYPFYFLYEKKDPFSHKIVFHRHSDEAVRQFVIKKQGIDKMLAKYGYDGKKYPFKYSICTETNIPSKTYIGKNWIGSNEAQRNFTIKAYVMAQKILISKLYLYMIGQVEDEAKSINPYGLMGLYKNLKTIVPGQEELSIQGVSFKTTSEILNGYTYDQAKTKSLNLSPELEGAAFTQKSKSIYVLWAKTTTDMSEDASGVYSFPSSLVSGKLGRREWYYSSDKNEEAVPADHIKLSGSPSFFITK